jgi:hypothetical protein
MSSLNSGINVLFQRPDLSFSLVGAHLSDLGSADLTFTDGSDFLQANSGNSRATSLSTFSGNDLLVGSRAAGASFTASSSADGRVSFGGSSSAGSLSGDGRYAVFQSTAGNLLPGPAPAGGAYNLKDLTTGELLFVGNAEIANGITTGMAGAKKASSRRVRPTPERPAQALNHWRSTSIGLITAMGQPHTSAAVGARASNSLSGSDSGTSSSVRARSRSASLAGVLAGVLAAGRVRLPHAGPATDSLIAPMAPGECGAGPGLGQEPGSARLSAGPQAGRDRPDP